MEYIILKALKIWLKGSGRTVWGKEKEMIFINRQGLDVLGGSSLVCRYWHSFTEATLDKIDAKKGTLLEAPQKNQNYAIWYDKGYDKWKRLTRIDWE